MEPFPHRTDLMRGIPRGRLRRVGWGGGRSAAGTFRTRPRTTAGMLALGLPLARATLHMGYKQEIP